MSATDETKADLARFSAFIAGRLHENAHRGDWDRVKLDAPHLVAKMARKVEKLAASRVIGDQRGVRRHSADLAAWALKSFTTHGTPDETARLASALGLKA